MLQRHSRFLPLLLCYLPVLGKFGEAMKPRPTSFRSEGFGMQSSLGISSRFAAARPRSQKAHEAKTPGEAPRSEIFARAQALPLPWPPVTGYRNRTHHLLSSLPVASSKAFCTAGPKLSSCVKAHVARMPCYGLL